MSKITVPAAPLPSFAEDARFTQSAPTPGATHGEHRKEHSTPAPSQRQAVPASRTSAPLDAAFLGRCYRMAGWFGLIAASGIYVATRSMLAAGSLLLGLAVGVLLLKSQELFVRLALRPPAEGSAGPVNLKNVLPLVFLLPLKIGVIGAVLMLLWRANAVNLLVFWAGFALVQLVLLTRLVLNLAQLKMKSVREVYVQPHQKHDR